MAVAGTGGGGGSKRRKPKPSARQSQQARSQQAAYGSQGRAVQRAATQQHVRQQTQRAARQARPLAARTVAPKPVPVARPPRTARPLAAAPPPNVRAGKPVTDAKQRRAVAVTAYNQLSGDAKRGHLAGAQKRVQQGKASETDVAILHAHSTRVQGNRKRVAATQAFNAIAGDPQKIAKLKDVAAHIPAETTNKLSTGSGKGLDLKPGHTYGPARKDGSRPILNPNGREVGVVAPLKRPNVGSVANLPSLKTVGKAVTAAGAASSKGWASVHAPKIVQNVPKDIADLAVTTPSSMAKLASDVVHRPDKVPGELVQPYKDLVKDPKKFITERPVSAALMVAPAVRVPGRLAGRAARAAGKQTLARPAAVLPGSPLKQARTGSRGAVTRAAQARTDRRKGSPTMTAAHVQRRVDEFYDFEKHHVARATASAVQRAQAKAKADKLPKAQERTLVQDVAEAARGGAKAHEAKRKFAQEFGSSTHRGTIAHPDAPTPGSPEFRRVVQRVNKVAELQHRGATAGERSAATAARDRSLQSANLELSPTGRIQPKQVAAVVTPRNAAQGALHDSREAAQVIADHLNAKNLEIDRGAHGLHQAPGRKNKQPLEFTVRDAGYGQFAVVPKIAAERLDTHRTIGKSKALGAREMRVAGRSFRNAVLPLSARWLVGQAGEAGFRAAVARAGPADVLRFNKIVKKMNDTQKGSGDEFLMRVTGGQFDLTGTAREFAHGRSLAEEFKGSAWEDPAHLATKAATSKPAMAVRKGWQRYTNVVFNTVNGWFEQNARKAMAGQAIRQGPLMEKHLVGMTEKALADAAKGLKGTDAQVQVARDVDRMYGKYQKFSPDLRERLLHTTPFYPWYRNMVTFLTQTLPVDHPLQAALIADLDAAEEEWRKSHGLSFHAPNRKPAFLQGGYPTASGGVKRVGRYLPFSPADPVEAGADLFLPQYGNIKAYLTGTDWKGDPVKGSRIKAAAGSAAQAHVPAAGQATRITKKIREGKSLKQALLDEIAPLPTTKGGTPKQKPGGGLQVPALELTPLQLQQLQLGG